MFWDVVRLFLGGGCNSLKPSLNTSYEFEETGAAYPCELLEFTPGFLVFS